MKKLINTLTIVFFALLATSCMSLQGGAYSQSQYDDYYYEDQYYGDQGGVNMQVFYNTLSPHGRWIRHNVYGEVFTIPEPSIRTEVAVVPGVDGQKMSKSYNNTVEIFAEPKDARSSIMKIVTDSKTVAEPKDPEQCNVFALYKLFASEEERAAMAERYRAGGLGYGDAKKALHEKFEAHFGALRQRRAELQKDMGYVESVLRKGAERARVEADKTLKKARQAVGLE